MIARGGYMVKNLRKLRLSRNMSQQQLADVIGTSQQSINKYENRSVEPDICGLTKLADYFGTTIDFLVGRTPEHPGATGPEDLDLSRDETALVRHYRRLTREEKESIRLILKNYLKGRLRPEET